MSNQSQSNDLQALYDLELANATQIINQLTTLYASAKPNYNIGPQSVDNTNLISTLNASLEGIEKRLEQIKRLQNIVNPYYIGGCR